MPLYDKIRDLIGAYYDANLDSHQFRESFADLFTESDTADFDTENLAIEVEALFGDFIDGVIQESDLKTRLLKLAPSIRLQVQVVADVANDDPAYRFFQLGPSRNTPPSTPTQSRSSGSDTTVIDPRLTPCLT